MTTERHLARSRDGMVIHRDTCRHARMPWHWPDRATVDELLAAKMRMGYRTYRVCEPSLYPESDRGLCISCGLSEPRPLPDPIPDDTEVMFTESMAGRSLYCQVCFDAEPDKPE